MQCPYDLTLAHAGLLWCFILAHAGSYYLTLAHAWFCAVLPLPMQGPYDLTLAHAGLLWCFTLAHARSYDLTLAHAGFLCRLTVAHSRVVAMFHPGSCRFLWFNLCPCRVLCRLTLALAGFLGFNPWTFAREYTVYMNYTDLAVRCLKKVLNLFACSLTLPMQGFCYDSPARPRPCTDAMI